MISRKVERELWALARAGEPQEVCGFIDLDAQEVLPLTNVAEEPTIYYTAARSELIEAVLLLRRRRADFAVYHSHPTRHATPSEGDKDTSGTYRNQVILSLRFAELRAYVVEGRQWTEVAVNQQESGV